MGLYRPRANRNLTALPYTTRCSDVDLSGGQTGYLLRGPGQVWGWGRRVSISPCAGRTLCLQQAAGSAPGARHSATPVATRQCHRPGHGLLLPSHRWLRSPERTRRSCAGRQTACGGACRRPGASFGVHWQTSTACAALIRRMGSALVGTLPGDALEGGAVTPPPPSRARSVHPATVWRSLPASTAFGTDSNRPQPLRQPPQTPA